jgi:hypothetical protein
MRITRYQDLLEGDTLLTSAGPSVIGDVRQYVAWAHIDLVRVDDLTTWSLTVHDTTLSRFVVERDDLVWSCPVCGGSRRVIHGFPLGGRFNPRGENLGTRIVCKDLKCAHSYWLAPGERDPRLTPNPNVPVVETSTPDPVLSVGDQVTLPRSHWIWKITRITGDTIRARNGDGKTTSFSRSDVLDVVERKKRP